MPRRDPPKPDDPDRLIRQTGGYRTADERFDVQGSAGRWFVTDLLQTDELGQPLIHGPYVTLDELRTSLADARRRQAEGAPRLRVLHGSGSTSGAQASRRGSPPGKAAGPKPQPPATKSWIQQLPTAEARRVRGLIRALEREGVARAEALVHRDRDGLLPAVATELIERRLEAILAELQRGDRMAAKATIEKVVQILTADGAHVPSPLPGWLLVEVGPEGEPPNRRIKPGIR